MTDTSRSGAATPDREPILSWDLIPDAGAPSRAMMMRFASYEAAQTVLTKAGFIPIIGSAHLLRHPDGRIAGLFARPDGSAMVLAQPLAPRQAGAER